MAKMRRYFNVMCIQLIQAISNCESVHMYWFEMEMRLIVDGLILKPTAVFLKNRIKWCSIPAQCIIILLMLRGVGIQLSCLTTSNPKICKMVKRPSTLAMLALFWPKKIFYLHFWIFFKWNFHMVHHTQLFRVIISQIN